MTDFRVDGTLGVNVTDFIRDMRAARAELQGMKDDVEELNTQLNSLSDKRVNVRVDIDGQDEIRQLRDDLDRLSRQTVDIRVNLDLDEAAITRLRADLQRIRDLGDVNVNVRVDVDGLSEVDRLYRRLRAMALRRWTIDVDIDVDGLLTAITALTTLRTLIRGTTGDLGGMGDSAGSAGGALGGMGSIIGGLLPLFVALGTVAAGVGAGVVGAVSTMAVGIGAFALFAAPTFKAISEAAKGTKEDFNKLSPPMQRAVTNLRDLKARFKELQEELQPVALEVFAEALNFARAGMEQLYKAAKPAGQAIRDLLADAAEGLMGDDWTKFFNYVRDNIGYFITTWGHAVGNFVTGIANMIVAFDPLAKFVSDGFLGMSERFLEWTRHLDENQQFQAFIQFVMTNGPIVMDLLGQFFSAAMQLAIAMAPLGAGMLQVLTQIMGWVAQLLQANPQLAQFLGVVIPLTLLLSPLVSGIMGVIGALAGLSGPALLVVAAIAAIIAIVVVWWTQCESFREFVKEFWAAVSETFSQWVQQIKDMIADWLPAIVELWNKYGESIKQYVMGMWEIISGVISGALKAIRGIVNIVLGLLTGDWRRVWNGIKQVLSGVWTAIKSIISGGKNAVLGLVRGLLTAIGNILKGAWNLLYNAGKNIIKGLINGIKSMGGSVKDAVGSILSGARNMLPFSPAKEGPFSGSGWTVYSGRAIVESLGQGMRERMLNLRATMREVMAVAHGDISGAVSVNANRGYQPKMSQAGALSAAVSGGGQVTFAEGAFKIFNPSAETPSDTINRTMTRVSRFGIFEGVGAP